MTHRSELKLLMELNEQGRGDGAGGVRREGRSTAREQHQREYHRTTITKIAVLETSTDDKGSWSINLPPQPATIGYTHTLTISDNVDTVTLVDIVFGDVYLCSGQVRSSTSWYNCKDLVGRFERNQGNNC